MTIGLGIRLISGSKVRIGVNFDSVKRCTGQVDCAVPATVANAVKNHPRQGKAEAIFQTCANEVALRAGVIGPEPEGVMARVIVYAEAVRSYRVVSFAVGAIADVVALGVCLVGCPKCTIFE